MTGEVKESLEESLRNGGGISEAKRVERGR